MPGALGYAWHEGNRGEYLAQYFLTALGVSAPVIRQEDIGVDFYCALAREENRKLHVPFTFYGPTRRCSVQRLHLWRLQEGKMAE